MRLEGARFTGLPSTTKPSTKPSTERRTKKNCQTPLRRWYWRSSQQRYPQVYYPPLARLEYNQSHLRKKSFEFASYLWKPSEFSYEPDCCKGYSNLNAKGLDASSSRPPADLQLFTEGSELDNDHNSCGRFLGSYGKKKSLEKSSHDVDKNREPYGTRYILPDNTRNVTPADFKVSYHKHDHDDLENNDLEFPTGLDDACTAFRVKSREYNHATTCAWSQSMEDRRGRKASKEKKKDFCAFELQDCRKETYWTAGNVDAVGIRSTHITKRKFSISEDETATTTSLDICVRVRENGAVHGVAIVDAYSVIDFSSPECSPYDVLNNTAFTDDDDYDDKNDDGDNEVDYDNYDDDDDNDGYNDNYNICGSTNCCVFWSKVEKFENDTSRRSVSTGSCRLDNTKKSCDLWHGFEKLVEEEKDNSFDNCDKDCYGRILETSACVDVPGGRLCTDISPSRSSIHGSGMSFMGNEDNLVFFKKYRKTEHVDYKLDKSRDYDGRYPRRPHECEKWKRPRRRRRRKYAKNKEKFIGECCDGYGNSDDRVLLAEECNMEYCKGDEEENVYTARLGGPVTRVEEKHKRKSKWFSEFNENLAKTQEDKSAKGRCPSNLKPRRRGIERKYKGASTGSKRGARSYGLLFVLYLLALPILCSTDSSGPVAAAFAQKSPLTHSDNFTARNSSLQHQGHQMRRDGGSGHDSSHPYNEYTWEVNQINPWLSACDLAGPAPADLQGSCGPPEVPKNCPIQCTTKSQTDGDRAFHEVIERLGVHDRAKTGAGGSRWRPAGTTTTINKKNNNRDENGNKRTEETVTAPEQCLFYLEESHKRNICRDKFGRGSSLSFSNPRENRYWFMSGLRLRHCCEHPVVNALAPGKGGPLEDVLNGGRKCAEALDKLLLVDALAARLHCEFEEVLARYDCAQPYSVIHNCTHCKEAYRKWVCSSLVPYFAHGGPPALETSANTWPGSRLRPCRSFCQSVEQRCPYLLPGDRAPAYPTQYAGEPTFLCRDPNIPETGEQAMRALHGNEEEECCFHVCSEIEPGSGVCANCTDRRPHSHRAGHDASTAPQCEITSTSPIQSISTGHQNNAEVSGSSSHGSLESATASSSPSTTTSASFCGGGGVGSMSSSSGQSTTQTPPPSSISLICLFWIWAALISLCTGQAVFPWVPPSSLLMLDHSSSGGAISSQRLSPDYSRNKKNFSSSSISVRTRNIVKVVVSWWSCSSSAPSLSSIPPRSSASSRPRFRKSVLQLARVFLISLTKTIHDCLRSFVNFFLVLLDSLLRNCVKCHYWHRRLWRYAWCGTICSKWFKQKFNKAIYVGWNLSKVCKERGWTEGPGYCCCCCCCYLKGIWCCDSNNNEPRPPRGRRRKRRRGRRRRRRRRHRRFLPHLLHTLQLPLLLKLLRPLWNSTIVTGPGCIVGLTLLVMNRRYYYGDASTWLRWWYSCFYRSQRHSYSYFKWKGPS